MNDDLQQAINTLTEKLSLADLAKARDCLTSRYRNPDRYEKTVNFMQSDLERLSYLVTRMPATYATIEHVLNEVNQRLPHLKLESMLDLGAGPGTAYFVAINLFSAINKICLIEQDKDLIKLGQSLERLCQFQSFADWKQGDMTHLKNLEQYDLVTISYAMNELNKQNRQMVINEAWRATANVLVIIEPGTMEGFGNIREARDQLIELGAHLIAPCPHGHKCPIPENDWCHFSTRISRTSLHRNLKSGSLGYEDEKFSYVAVSKLKADQQDSRIIRHPEKHSGHIVFKLCTKDEGLISKTISKRDKELYKKARKLEWGDLL